MPSILSADFANLQTAIESVPSSDAIHVDVMDNHFVPNLTLGLPVVESIRKITDKIFFGTDYPFTTVEESIEGLRTINRLVEGTGLPRVAEETIEGIIYSDPFEHWWQRNPL